VKTLLTSALAIGVMTTAALAEETVMLTDAQMDAVTAGAPPLIDVTVVDVVDVRDVNVAIPANVGAAVAAGVLGTAGALNNSSQRGNIDQP
jgi:hypothetical protein